MCNKCGSNKPTPVCGCNKPKLYGCTTKVDAKCVNYSGGNLTPLGVVGGDNLEDILKIINELFRDLLVKLEDNFIGENVGHGSEIFKGLGIDGRYEFRTIEGGVGIIVEQKGDVVEIKADPEFFNTNFKTFLNDSWFRNHFKTLIKQDWFVEYLQTLTQQSWFENQIRYWIQQEWFRDYIEMLLKESWFKRVLSELLRQQWFVEVLKEVLNQPWFIDLICLLLRQPWFEDLLKEILDKEWFRTFVKSIIGKIKTGDINIELLKAALEEEWFLELLKRLIKRPWFVDYLKTLFNEQWFVDIIRSILNQPWFLELIKSLIKQPWFISYLFEIFNGDEFRRFFATYITKLITDGLVDICALVQKCKTDTPPPVNTAPYAAGDIEYNVSNRGVKVANLADFDRVYRDDEGDAYTAIRITGGDLTNLVLDSNPVTVGQVIPKNKVSSITFTGRDTDQVYRQEVIFDWVQ